MNNCVFVSYFWCVCSLQWCSGIWGSQQLWCRWEIPLSLCLCWGWPPDPCSLRLSGRLRSPRRRRRGCQKTGQYAGPWWLWLEPGHSRTLLGSGEEEKKVIVRFISGKQTGPKKWDISHTPPLLSWGVGSRTCQPSMPDPRSLRVIQHSTHTWKFLLRGDNLGYHWTVED